MIPEVLEILHGRDAAPAHLHVFQPRLQVPEHRSQHEVEEGTDLQISIEIEIADIDQSVADLRYMVDSLVGHPCTFRLTSHSYSRLPGASNSITPKQLIERVDRGRVSAHSGPCEVCLDALT